jgi:N-acyl amino acid synthase of PEP-CTERM/exosortase system
MYLPDFLNLGIAFTKYFTAIPALDDAVRREAYRIRHSVYCDDLAYEKSRADGLETDDYDAHSMQCVLKHRTNGDYVGCIRLVLARPDDPHYPLPFEKACASAIDRSVADPARFPRDKIAEVSRLAVISRYRRRKGEASRPADITEDDFGTRDQPRFPFIPVGLYLAMMAQAQRHGIETLFVLTQPRLARHLSRLGVEIKRIGDGVEHRGLRVPSLISVNAVISGFGVFVRPLFDVIAGQLDTAYRQLEHRG